MSQLTAALATDWVGITLVCASTDVPLASILAFVGCFTYRAFAAFRVVPAAQLRATVVCCCVVTSKPISVILEDDLVLPAPVAGLSSNQNRQDAQHERSRETSGTPLRNSHVGVILLSRALLTE